MQDDHNASDTNEEELNEDWENELNMIDSDDEQSNYVKLV